MVKGISIRKECYPATARNRRWILAWEKRQRKLEKKAFSKRKEKPR